MWSIVIDMVNGKKEREEEMKEIVIKVECKGNFEETIKEIKDVLEKVAKEMKYKDKKVRWRAEREGTYYHFDGEGEIRHAKEDFHKIDNMRFEFGNYFKSEKEAGNARKKIETFLLDEKNKFDGFGEMVNMPSF